MSKPTSQDHRAPRLGEVPGHPETPEERMVFAAFDLAKTLRRTNPEALREATGTTWEPGQ